MNERPPISTLFPYTTLFRSSNRTSDSGSLKLQQEVTAEEADQAPERRITFRMGIHWQPVIFDLKDRKSTRLNSSHLGISYAVFCLKKKKKNTEHKYLSIYTH